MGGILGTLQPLLLLEYRVNLVDLDLPYIFERILKNRDFTVLTLVWIQTNESF